MKKLFRLAAVAMLAALATSCSWRQGKAGDGAGRKRFTNEVLLRYTPVKDQGRSPLCWAYSMLSTIETEHIMMGDSVNLSVDYMARRLLAEQARCHFLSRGYDRITLRGTMPLLLRLVGEYGIVPYDSYNAPSVNYVALGRRLALLSKGSVDMSQMSRRAEDMFDKRIGHLPKTVYMFGAEYTPMQFAHSVCMRGEYMALTSFTHHPFGENFAIEVPDNYSDELFYNVPIDVMMRRIERSLRMGHPVCWEGDVSEPGFSFERGVAELPDERPCTQEERQKAFEMRRTTDDHCMSLIGIAHDASGHRYYIAKNSYGTGNPYGGLMYLSENYVRLKTIAVVVKSL